MLEIRLSETLVLKIPILQFLVVPDAMSIHKIQKEIFEDIDILWLNPINFVSPQKCMNESIVDTYYFHLIQAWNVLQLVMTTMFAVRVLQIWPETGKNVTNLLGISWPNFVITVKPIHVLTNLYVKVIY